MEGKAMSDQLPPYNEAGLKEWLKPVEDPELFISLVELGLVYEIDAQAEGKVDVKMSLTSPGCPMGPQILHMVKERLLAYPGVTAVDVRIVFDPKWDPREMASEEAKDKLGIW
jgi:metal-sulfur cluster biosynthetic enzyme